MRAKYGAACEHVLGAQPGGQERLVGVAQRRVRDRHRAQLAQPTGEAVGTELVEELAAAAEPGRRPGLPLPLVTVST